MRKSRISRPKGPSRMSEIPVMIYSVSPERGDLWLAVTILGHPYALIADGTLPGAPDPSSCDTTRDMLRALGGFTGTLKFVNAVPVELTANGSGSSVSIKQFIPDVFAEA